MSGPGYAGDGGQQPARQGPAGWLIGLVVVLGVILVGLLVYIFVFADDDVDSAEPTQPPATTQPADEQDAADDAAEDDGEAADETGSAEAPEEETTGGDEAADSGVADLQAPPNSTDEGGILVDGVVPSADVPHVIIYQDYSCPPCKFRHDDFAPVLAELVEEGEITVEYRTAHFLDARDGATGGSIRAAVAAATADTVGRFADYQAAIYENQGSDYPPALLRDEIPQELGIEGDDLAAFQQAYDEGTYLDFAFVAHETFLNSGANSTPTYVVNDMRLLFGDTDTNEVFIENTPESFLDAVTKAFAGEDDRTHEPLAG
ncbi:MAG: thioredoxin domain-containing protein [Propionibacterium sp.]|nr:thioredoxin domain-containing protein [Propionibacterium sp.]